MRVVLVGGSGHVGSLITPYLQPHHEVVVLDPRPPRHPGVTHVEGSAADPEALAHALEGSDAFIYLVMRQGQDGVDTNQDLPTIVENYEVNTKALHLLLFMAHERGIKRGIYTSSMSVHYRRRTWYPGEEMVPLDTPSVYGMTKGLGELICAYFARWFDMNLIALRITGPRSREQWLAERRTPSDLGAGRHLYVTDEEDLAEAYLRALEVVATGHGRFDAIFIAGDENEQEHNLSKARHVLGWQPRSQRLLSP